MSKHRATVTVWWLLSLWGLFVFGWGYGYMARGRGWAPAPLVSQAHAAANELFAKAKGSQPWYVIPTTETRTVIALDRAQMAPGLTLVAGLGEGGGLNAQLVNTDGEELHHWDLDWFRVWPNPTHLPKDAIPKARPGGNLHGVQLSQNGDLTVVYEHLGLIQFDVCGRVKWRLPVRTHHSLFVDEQGNFWTLAITLNKTPDARVPNYKPPFHEDMVMQVSPDGKILQWISTLDVLADSGWEGLLYAQLSAGPTTHLATDDALHTNDVDVFPNRLKPGVFKPGDVMLSLRNANAVVVFDPNTLKIRHAWAGRTVRQHDPDFQDGSTITVFDNNNIVVAGGSSRIVSLSAKTSERKVLFQGTTEQPFFSAFMGRHQRLPNNGFLITEAVRGRVFEVSPAGQIIWEYFNHVGEGRLGVISNAARIPPALMDAQRLSVLANMCSATTAADPGHRGYRFL